MGLVDDFIVLPNSLKILAFLALLTGTTIKIPLIGFSIGDIISPFFRLVFGAFGIAFDFKQFVIICFIIALIMFIHSFQKTGA